LDILYSTEDTGSEEVQKMRTKPDSFYALQQTKVRIVPTHAKKPDAALLTSILNDLNVPPTSAIYVGDDLRKDILMANEAHVTSVHAKYGQAHKDSRYELLQAVTHWPRRDVDAQQDDEAGGKPDYVLQASFPEILSLFKFVAYLPK
jgi:FMN phosphatase YigB (HAD superfamily)